MTVLPIFVSLCWGGKYPRPVVPAVSEVVRALCGLVELLGAGNNVAQFRSAAVACGVSLLERNAVCACVQLLVRLGNYLEAENIVASFRSAAVLD